MRDTRNPLVILAWLIVFVVVAIVLVKLVGYLVTAL